MSEYTIGIKTGDGLFYPILEESFKGKKRFVLTTVNDNQSSVQIDFYRSEDKKIDDAEYIGSLVIENIEPAPKKMPEIEVIIGIDAKSSLHAVARNLSSENDKQSLTVSLESLSSGMTYDIPEFELDEKLQPTSLFESDQDLDDSTLIDEAYPIKRGERSKESPEKKKPNLLFIILFVLAGLIIIAAVTFGIFFLVNMLNKSPKPPIDINTAANSVKTEQVAATATPEPTVQKTEIQKTEPPRVAAQSTQAKESKVLPQPSKKKEAGGGGYWYTIKKGDTLWDIAERVYGNPWSYYKIYTSNKKQIRNPDLIFSGNKIYLP